MIGNTLFMILIALSTLSPCNGINDNDYLSENDKEENEIDPLKATFDGDWKSPTPVTGLAVYGYVELLTERPWYEIPLCSIKTELFIDGESAVDSNQMTSNSHQDQCGEGQEDSVITYLWNLFDDSDECNMGDTISFSEKEFLDLTLVDGVTTTLPNFIEYFESKYPNLIFDNGAILEACKIAPTIVSYNEDVSQSIPLTINFIANGSCYNPNDKYIIEFYNGSKNRLTYMSITPEINGNRGVSTYTISYSKWTSIYQILKSETTVYVSIVGYLSSNPESGPYRSSLTKLPISRWSSDIIIKDPYEKYYSLGESE